MSVVGWGPFPWPWERKRDEASRRAAFEMLRRLDEELCASKGFVGCCDAHPSG